MTAAEPLASADVGADPWVEVDAAVAATAWNVGDGYPYTR